MADVNIKIPVLDQTVELVKDFLQKVINPSLEEVGGLLADQIRLFRFKKQINVVTSAESYLKEKNIETRKVSLKVLAPLLEYCSLEEDESLQQKWIALLVNTTRKNSNINNPLYSYLLSQLSPEDAKNLQTIYSVITQTDEQDGTSMTVFSSGSSVKMSFSQETVTDSLISIDNLIRLRLVKEIQLSMDNSPLTLTNLGFTFLNYCKLS